MFLWIVCVYAHACCTCVFFLPFLLQFVWKFLLVRLLACLLSKEQESKGKWECARDGRGSGMSWERGKQDQNILSDFLN